MDMVHLHVHSQYSMQDGLCSLDDLVKQATKFKMKAVALTDHDGFYGAIQFYKKAKKSGIKPIVTYMNMWMLTARIRRLRGNDKGGGVVLLSYVAHCAGS